MMRSAILLAWAACTALAQTPRFIAVPAPDTQSRPFSLARTETTVEQFAAFVNSTHYRTEAEKAGAPRTWKTPGFPVTGKQPVVYVTPTDALAYCSALGARLPTDREWEFAARAGATTRHYWGESLDPRYLWYRANSKGRPHPVATRRPNAWGLHDMEGNVWEWALSPSSGEPMANRRGGSWIDCEDIDGGPGKPPGNLIGLSVFFKVAIGLQHRYDDIGFRCAK